MSGAGHALWPAFVDDGGAYAATIRTGVDELVKARRIGAALDRHLCESLGDEAYRLATVALLLGVDEIARLALVCERAFDQLGKSPERSIELLPLCAAAAEALAAAFRVLAAPDASGARVDKEPLLAAAAELQQGLDSDRLSLLEDLATSRSAVYAVRAATATAVSAAAAAAASAAAHAVKAIGTPVPTGDTPPPAAPNPLASAPAAPPAGAARARTTAPPPEASEAFVWVPQVDEEMVELFFEEAAERLDGLAEKLVRLESAPDDRELVREVFRDLHTLKGSSAMVGLQPVNKLAHVAEDLVGQVRDGGRRAEPPVVDALLGGLDALRAMVDRARRREPLQPPAPSLLARLRDPVAAAAVPAEAAAAEPQPAAATAAAAEATPGPARSRHEEAAQAALKQTLRVDFDKLDLLLNLVGELVLGKSGLGTGIAALGSLGREIGQERQRERRRRRAGHSPPAAAATGADSELGRIERVFAEIAADLERSSGQVSHVAAELRDQVMKLRMVPVGGIFRKHHRTVRDLAASLDKRVRLELAGEETELDKVLVEQLDDPLMHLVRNAVDHGIESPAARAAAGKPVEGLVRLTAAHRGNQITIELSDDGGGIDPERLRRKAREKGLISDAEAESLDDRAALELIFRAGLSTAARVSEVSGRGVGMDVVRDAIVKRLKGEIEVHSVVGKGTRFVLRLPLTLAIIQVLLAGVGGEVFALPLDAVTRTIAIGAGEVHRGAGGRELITVRERQVPLVRLAQVLELDGAGAAAAAIDDREPLHVILIESAGQPFGLVCDRLVGKQEIVIKSLGEVLARVPCVAGATLLGERVALILDLPAVIARATGAGRAAPPAPRPAPPGASSPAAAAARPRRVLLVDDSEMVRAALRRQLEGGGYQVVEARDGAEGLELARAGEFDLISTDVVMPRMDGYELTRALRADPRTRDVPIVMVTSRGEKIDRVRGFDAGVDDYITKPNDRQEYLRTVARLLGAKP